MDVTSVLPDELLGSILTHVDDARTLLSLRLVSHRFRDMLCFDANTHQLMTFFKIKGMADAYKPYVAFRQTVGSVTTGESASGIGNKETNATPQEGIALNGTQLGRTISSGNNNDILVGTMLQLEDEGAQCTLMAFVEECSKRKGTAMLDSYVCSVAKEQRGRNKWMLFWRLIFPIVQERQSSAARAWKHEFYRNRVVPTLAIHGYHTDNVESSLFAVVGASEEPHLDSIRLLLESGADVHAINDDGLTVLNFAAQEGRVDVVNLLLDSGASVNGQANGVSALHCAAFGGHEAVVVILLSRGAAVMARSSDRLTALHYSARQGHDTVVQVLIEHGADVNAVDCDGESVLQVAARQGHLAIVQLLLQQGANADHQDRDGTTALHSATWYGHDAIALLLLHHVTRVDVRDSQGVCPLSWAAAHGREDVVRALVANGADVNAEDQHGVTALLRAAVPGHVDTMRFLVEQGADTTGWPPMQWDNE